MADKTQGETVLDHQIKDPKGWTLVAVGSFILSVVCLFFGAPGAIVAGVFVGISGIASLQATIRKLAHLLEARLIEIESHQKNVRNPTYTYDDDTPAADIAAAERALARITRPKWQSRP